MAAKTTEGEDVGYAKPPSRRGQLAEGSAKALRVGADRQKEARERRLKKGKRRTGERDEWGVPVISRSTQLERGIIKIWQLDNDELARRMCKNANGDFTGCYQFKHSPKIYDAMDRELLRRGNDALRRGFVPATEQLVSLLQHPDANVKIKAIDRIMERVSGKVPDKLITADMTPHSELHADVTAALAAALGLDADPNVIEGEIVGDEGAE